MTAYGDDEDALAVTICVVHISTISVNARQKAINFPSTLFGL